MSTQIWVNVHPHTARPASLPGMLVQYAPSMEQSIIRLDKGFTVVPTHPAGFALAYEGNLTPLPWLKSIAGIIRVRHRSGPRTYSFKTRDKHNLLLVSPGAKDFLLYANGAKRVAFSASRGEATYHCGRIGRVELSLTDDQTAFEFKGRIGTIEHTYLLRAPSELARVFRDFYCLCKMAEAATAELPLTPDHANQAKD